MLIEFGVLEAIEVYLMEPLHSFSVEKHLEELPEGLLRDSTM